MLKIITGADAQKNSYSLVSQMVDSAVKNPQKKHIIIVPEQFTLSTQKRVAFLHPRKATMNIDVVSFDRLARVILSKLGIDSLEILDDVGKALILRRVLEELQKELHVYGNKVSLTGFVEETQSLITEFKQYRVSDDALGLIEDAQEGILKEKIKDIRLIYRRFNEEIEDRYNTTEEILLVCESLMYKSDFIKNCNIYLDGFTGFTPVQIKYIGTMMSYVDDICCTVTIPEEKIAANVPEYDLFKLSNQTYNKLLTFADEHRIRAFTENVQAEIKKERVIYQGGLSSIENEISYVIQQILNLVKNHTYRYRDIAVLTSDMESYYQSLKKAFVDANIPAFIDYKAEFSDNVLVRFIMAALEISSRGMSFENMFGFFKSGLLDVNSNSIDILENYCLEFNIHGRSRWEADFTLNRNLQGSDKQAWDLEKLNEVRKRAVSAINVFYGATCGGKHKVAIFCKAMKKLLEAVNAEKKIQDMAETFSTEGNLVLGKQYEQIYDQVTELLDKINKISGNENMTAREFSDMMTSGIRKIKIAVIPPALDTLVIGDLTRTRLDDVKCLFMLGMNDGKIPSGGSGSIILTQKEREIIKNNFEISPTILENIYTQRFYLYLAFDKPEEQLYILWAGIGNNGEEMTKSCILEDLDELIPGLDKSDIHVLPSGENTLWKSTARKKLAEDFQNKDFSGDEGLLKAFAETDPEIIRIMLNGSLFSVKQTPLDDQVALDLYGDALRGSVSRFETFYECPYRHFLNYGIGLEKRREYEIKATELGTIYHNALEYYSKGLKEKELSFRTISDDESHKLIETCVEAAIKDCDRGVLESSARNTHLKKRIGEITAKTTDILRSHVRAGLFEPYEYEFSFNEKISETLEFRGKVDRVDLYDAGDVFVKIIDYKSGSKEFSIKDIYYGIQLQLLAYMKSTISEVKKSYPEKNVRPGGVYYYLINDKYLRDENELLKGHVMSGVTSCEPGVMHAVDMGLETEKSKSNIIKTKSVANEKEFMGLMNFVGERIEQAAERIHSGEIDISPFREGSHTGCAFCDYGDICKFREEEYESRFREADEDSKVIEEQVYGRN